MDQVMLDLITQVVLLDYLVKYLFHKQLAK